MFCGQAFEELAPVSTVSMVLDSIILLTSHSYFSFLSKSSLIALLLYNLGMLGEDSFFPLFLTATSFSLHLHIFQRFFRLISPQPVSLHVIFAIIFSDLKVQVSNLLNFLSFYFTATLKSLSN